MQLYLAYEQLAAQRQDEALQQKKVVYKPPPVDAASVADRVRTYRVGNCTLPQSTRTVLRLMACVCVGVSHATT